MHVVLLVSVRLPAQAVQPGPVEFLADHALAPPLLGNLGSLDAPGIVIETVNCPEQNIDREQENNACQSVKSPPPV